jgi:hypothetical protein
VAGWIPIRDALVALYQGVPSIGKVHGRYRYSNKLGTNADWKALFATAAASPDAWMINPTKPPLDEKLDDDDNSFSTTHEVEIVAFRARVDGLLPGEDSQTPWDTLLEAVRAAFRALPDRTLGGACHTFSLPQNASEEAFGQFQDGTLCHFARWVMQVEEIT